MNFNLNLFFFSSVVKKGPTHLLLAISASLGTKGFNTRDCNKILQFQNLYHTFQRSRGYTFFTFFFFIFLSPSLSPLLSHFRFISSSSSLHILHGHSCFYHCPVHPSIHSCIHPSSPLFDRVCACCFYPSDIGCLSRARSANGKFNLMAPLSPAPL